MSLAVDVEQHFGEERGLRAGEVVSAVRVQNLPIILYFEHEIVGHILCEIELAIAEQSELNEIAVPSVHLVEPASRHDVRARQEQKTLVLHFREIGRQPLD